MRAPRSSFCLAVIAMLAACDSGGRTGSPPRVRDAEVTDATSEADALTMADAQAAEDASAEDASSPEAADAGSRDARPSSDAGSRDAASRDATANDAATNDAGACASVTACRSGDGCCPAACSAQNDRDCPVAICGDGVVEPPESCDGDCPTSCDDHDLCTVDVMAGSADICDVACAHRPITACQPDGCCPSGCTFATDPDCAPAMSTEVLAPEHGGSAYAALAYDAAGEPHVVYADATDHVVRHTWRSAGVWQREVVDAAFAAAGEVYAPIHLVVDGHGALHVAYAVSTGAGGEGRYATNAGGPWRVETGAGLVFAVDAAGAPHFPSVTRIGTGYPYRFHLTEQIGAGPSATTREIAAWERPSQTPGVSSLAIWVDASGQSWFAFDQDQQVVRVAAPSGGAWSVTDTPLRTFDPNAFGVEADGTVHLLDGNSTWPTHAYGGGQFWSTERASVSTIPGVSRASVDASGVPFFLWIGQEYNSTAFQVATIHRGANGTWTVDPAWTWDLGFGLLQRTLPAVAGPNLDGQAVIFSALPDDVFGLGFTLVEPPTTGDPVVHGVDLRESVRLYDAAVAQDGTLRVAYTLGDSSYAWDHEVVHVASRGGTAAGSTVPRAAGTYGFSGLGVAVGASSEHVAFGGTYARRSGSAAWTSEATGIDATVLAVDANEVPHAAWVDNTTIRYGIRGAGGFSNEAVTPASAVGNLQIATDPNRLPYLLWTENYRHKFARRPASGTWQVAEVAYDGNAHGAALFVDAAGRPCVAHLVDSSSSGYSDLVASCMVGQSFQVTTVDPHLTGLYSYSIVAAGADGAGQSVLVVERGGTFGDPPIFEIHTSGASGWTVRTIPNDLPGPAGVYVDRDGKLFAVGVDPRTERLVLYRER